MEILCGFHSFFIRKIKTKNVHTYFCLINFYRLFYLYGKVKDEKKKIIEQFFPHALFALLRKKKTFDRGDITPR